MNSASSIRPLVASAAGSSSQVARGFHDYIRGSTSGGSYKLPLNNKQIVGIQSSRGSRLYQEDATAAYGLQLDVEEVRRNLRERLKTEWDPSSSGTTFMASQVGYFGIFDGHGGKEVSAYLKQNLHQHIENVTQDTIPSIIEYTKSHDGYYKRWRGGSLRRWHPDSAEAAPLEGEGMTLEERLALAFLTADKEVLGNIENASRCGATATVALLHSLDEPGQAYWAADKLDLTIAHLGDTRALLCLRETGECVTLTENHHADARIESARLRRMGADRLVSDSFGESRWMGVVENTRSIGDGEWKPSGVTAEPEIRSQILNGDDYAYLVLVTDGLSSLMSDQEIIDLARSARDPTRAARSIVDFAEDLGATDNCTCIVVPLKGWGRVGGKDTTAERRVYRSRQAGQMSGRMRRM